MKSCQKNLTPISTDDTDKNEPLKIAVAHKDAPHPLLLTRTICF